MQTNLENIKLLLPLILTVIALIIFFGKMKINRIITPSLDDIKKDEIGYNFKLDYDTSNAEDGVFFTDGIRLTLVVMLLIFATIIQVLNVFVR